MYGDRSLVGMGRSDLLRAREHTLHPGREDAVNYGREPQRDLLWQQQERNFIPPKRIQQGSLLGDPPLLPEPHRRGRGASPPQLGGNTAQRVSLGARDVLERPNDAFRHREADRLLDYNTGKHMMMADGASSRYAAPAVGATARDPLMRAGGALPSLEQERLDRERAERERQRQLDRQRRVELQRELELEREKMRRQKEEEEMERKRQATLERQREERRREEERARERERELQRQREKEEERRRIQREREETEREIERKKALIEQRGARLQQEIAQNREMRQREEMEKQRKLEMERMEMQRLREIQMLRQREAAIEQQMAINLNQQQMLNRTAPPPGQVMLQQQRMQMMPPSQPGIPSLLTMPKVSPSQSFQPRGNQRGSSDDLMEKVRLQQALLAQQQSGSRGQGQQQNQNRGKGQNQNRNRNRKRGSRWSAEGPSDNRNKSGNRNQSGLSPSPNRNKPQNRNQSQNRNQAQNRGQPQDRDQSRNGNDHKQQPGKGGDRSDSNDKRESGQKTTTPQKGDGGDPDAKKTPEKVLYDPLDPTDDEVGRTNERKRKQSEGELQVRIEQGTDSRDVLDPPAAKKTAIMVEGNPVPMTSDRMVREMRQILPKGMEWMCHACDAKCPDVMAYHKHMMGKRHQTMMAHLVEVAEANASEALEALRAEQHLERVQRGYKARGTSAHGPQTAHYCTICTMYLFSSNVDHRDSEPHKKALAGQHQSCKVCKKSFKTLNGFMNHCNAMSHKMLYEVFVMERQKEAALKAEAEKPKRKRNQAKTFVTVDEIGFEGENEGKEDKAGMEGMIDPMTNEPVNERRVQEAFKKLLHQKEPQSMVAVLEAMATGPKQSPGRDPMSPPLAQSTPPSAGEGSVNKKQPVPWDMRDLVFYNSDKIVGQEYVIPVTGFFCKLCRKFYNSENSARVIHCKSRAHFLNLKKLSEEMQHAADLAKEHVEGTAKPGEGAKPKAVAEGKGSKGGKDAKGGERGNSTADKEKGSTKEPTEDSEVIKIDDDDDEVVVVPDDDAKTEDGATTETKGPEPAKDGAEKQEGKEDEDENTKGDQKSEGGEAEQVMEVGTTEELQADQVQENGEKGGEDSAAEVQPSGGASAEGPGGDAEVVGQGATPATAAEEATAAMES